MSLADDWWVLLHGTPLTPAVWDGVAAHFAANAAVLRRGDPVDPEAALGRRAAPPSGSSGARCLMTRQRQHHALAH